MFFRTQLDELNEKFNETLLASHEFDVQDISDIEIPSDGNILGYLKVIDKVNDAIAAIETEFADVFKELNKENVEIIDPKVHLNLDLEKIVGGIIDFPLNSLAQEDNTMTIELPAFVKYSLKDETNSKVYLTQELEFSFKIPKIELSGFSKTNNKDKMVNNIFSSINLDKTNEEFATKLAAYKFKQQEISIDVSNVDIAYILQMLGEIDSIIKNIKEEISTQFGNVEGVLIDNINLGLDMSILSRFNLIKIFAQIKSGTPIEIPFVTSYTLNGKSYFADNLKAHIKINLSE